ncbi:hypothetical protein UCRPC4_g04952 [Phaeomoniella chlamydospora]|uniref:Mtf2-like C-terminal domain-containing protein n=1 Tax=Phaeomoniella chlamydospora TaxID=158046 RepID=A0A0G2E7W7_PHACM|nr:hypothetical protein UCRPC4_g04952 [Phaeomoniella chlamydospora]
MRHRASQVLFETQLPFLYETRSIQAFLRPGRRHATLFQRWQSTASSITDDIAFQPFDHDLHKHREDVEARLRLENVLARSKTLRQQSFLKRKAQSVQSTTPGSEAPKAPPKSISNLPSTITQAEKAIFRQIFTNLAQGRPASNPVSETKSDGEPETRPIFDLQVYLINDDYLKILDELYGASVIKKEQQQRHNVPGTEFGVEDVSAYPRALRRMAIRTRQAIAASRNPPEAIIEEDSTTEARSWRSAEVRNICIKALGQLAESLRNAIQVKAQGEAVSLQLCRQHIFPLLQEVQVPSFPTDQKSSQAEPKDSKETGRKKKKANNLKSNTNSTPTAEETAFKAPSTLRLPGGNIEIPRHISPMEVLSILCPAAMTLVLRHLIRQYPNSSAILSLLDNLHSRGPMSYVLGSSTQFYNTLLAHWWNQYSDFRGMEKVLNDMQAGAVPFDLTTLNIIDGVREERFFSLAQASLYHEDMSSDEEQKNMRPAWWWQMDSNDKEFRRLTELWRQTIVESLEDTDAAEEIPDITYTDEMLLSVTQDHDAAPVML